MRVLVTGGRSYDEWKQVHSVLVGLRPTVIIQGGANGADALARRWAQCNHIPLVTYEANWKDGRKAVIAHGYGHPRLNRTVRSFKKLPWAKAPKSAREIYPDASHIAAIELR